LFCFSLSFLLFLSLPLSRFLSLSLSICYDQYFHPIDFVAPNDEVPTPSGEAAAGLDATLNDQFIPSRKKHNEWTYAEEKILVKAQGRLRNSWAEFAKLLSGRSGGDVRSHCIREERKHRMRGEKMKLKFIAFFILPLFSYLLLFHSCNNSHSPPS
jgi:hypothetical protein